ncbi:MAG TPA: hypothetical protein VG455_02600 [Acidimicrobiales bacterium]|nr:hypothetical protein [Acidimicrobiales bacterium]
MPAAVMAAMLATFVMVEALALEPLTDPRRLLDAGGPLAAAAGTGVSNGAKKATSAKKRAPAGAEPRRPAGRPRVATGPGPRR